MKPVFVPNYYPRFRCIADACRHSCCVGWEIDVDEEALTRYDGVTGELRARLDRGIDRHAEPPCFRLTADERCPFLNARGLCDIITELGEEALCHICADHPRFRHAQSDRVELGLGLCCEAAGALILGQTEPVSLMTLPEEASRRERAAWEEPTPPEPFELSMRELRDEALEILGDVTCPVALRQRRLLRRMGVSVPDGSYAAWSRLLWDMERLDPAWEADLRRLACTEGSVETEPEGEGSEAYAHLLAYFLYRYMTAEDDGRAHPVGVRVAFAVISTALIHAILRARGEDSFETLVEVSRLYSSEIEYSEENMEMFFNFLEEACYPPDSEESSAWSADKE